MSEILNRKIRSDNTKSTQTNRSQTMNTHANLNPSSKTRNLRDRLGLTAPLAMLLMLLVGLSQPLTAAIYDWNVASGDWNLSSNWSPVPPAGGPAGNAGHSINLLNGSTLIPASTVYNIGQVSYADLSIGLNNTLSRTDTATIQPTFANIANAGTISSLNTSGRFALLISGATSNSGIIEAAGNGGELFIALNASTVGMTNTDGILRAVNGGTLQLRTNNNLGSGITGGTLSSDATSTIDVGHREVNQVLRLDDVAISNAGTFLTRSVVGNTGDRTVITQLRSGNVFANNGTTLVLNEQTGAAQNGTRLSVRFDVGAGATLTSTFNNAGTLRIRNISDRPGTSVQDAAFQVVTGSTFTNTGIVEVFHDTVAAGTRSSTFTSAGSITNQGTVHVRGNSNNVGASFTVTGTGNSYTQTGVGSSTLLERGGTLTAPAVAINGGTLGGNGTVTGNTTIAVNATVAPGTSIGTLEFSGDLTMDSGSIYNFEIADENSADVIVVSGALSLGDIVLNFHVPDYAPTRTDLLDFTLFSFGGAAPTIGNWTINPIGNAWYGSPQVSVVGNEVVLSGVGIIPEPTSLVLLALSGLAIYRRRARVNG